VVRKGTGRQIKARGKKGKGQREGR